MCCRKKTLRTHYMQMSVNEWIEPFIANLGHPLWGSQSMQDLASLMRKSRTFQIPGAIPELTAHKIVHSSAMHYKNLIIIRECSKKLLKMKNSKSFLTPSTTINIDRMIWAIIICFGWRVSRKTEMSIPV